MHRKIQKWRIGNGVSISFRFYYFVSYCSLTAKELKEKYLSAYDWYFSPQLNN